MPTNQTLGQALELEGSHDQKAILTQHALNLTKDQCIELLEGHDVGLKREDKESLLRLVKLRINKQMSLFPWEDVKLSDVDPNMFW